MRLSCFSGSLGDFIEILYECHICMYIVCHAQVWWSTVASASVQCRLMCSQVTYDHSAGEVQVTQYYSIVSNTTAVSAKKTYCGYSDKGIDVTKLR